MSWIEIVVNEIGSVSRDRVCPCGTLFHCDIFIKTACHQIQLSRVKYCSTRRAIHATQVLFFSSEKGDSLILITSIKHKSWLLASRSTLQSMNWQYFVVKVSLDVSIPFSYSKSEYNHQNKGPNDSKERYEILNFSEWHHDVHAEHSTDQI